MITAVESFPLAYREPHYLGAERCVTLVRITADDGTFGWGEAISQFREASIATKTLVDDGFAPLLVGNDPGDVEGLWREMCQHAYWYGVEGIAAFAISAIDLALWDLKGKLKGQPVAALLGSSVRDRIPAMGSIIFDMEDLERTVAEFETMVERGYPIVKAGWGMRPEAMFGDNADRDREFLTRIRSLIGPDIELVVDTPGARGIWDLDTAIERLRDWEEFRLRWVEQPLPPAALDDYAELRRSVAVPIGAGEDEWSPETYGHVIAGECVDVLQLDPGRCLGLTGCRQVIEMVEAAGISYSAHSWSSAINTAASLHFLAISESADTLDFKPHESPMQHELVTEPWVPVDGMLAVPSEPGLGVEVRPDAIERFRFG